MHILWRRLQFGRIKAVRVERADRRARKRHLKVKVHVGVQRAVLEQHERLQERAAGHAAQERRTAVEDAALVTPAVLMTVVVVVGVRRGFARTGGRNRVAGAWSRRTLCATRTVAQCGQPPPLVVHFATRNAQDALDPAIVVGVQRPKLDFDCRTIRIHIVITTV